MTIQLSYSSQKALHLSLKPLKCLWTLTLQLSAVLNIHREVFWELVTYRFSRLFIGPILPRPVERVMISLHEKVFAKLQVNNTRFQKHTSYFFKPYMLPPGQNVGLQIEKFFNNFWRTLHIYNKYQAFIKKKLLRLHNFSSAL